MTALADAHNSGDCRLSPCDLCDIEDAVIAGEAER